MYILVGASLSKPHIDHNNGSMHGIIVSEYLSMHHLPHICCTLLPEICVCSEMLYVSWYIDVLTCMHSKDNWWGYLTLSTVKIIYEYR